MASSDLHAATHELVSELHTPRPSIFWTDLAASAGVGWTAFAAAGALQPFSLSWAFALAVAVLALYRGLCFIHEITHLKRRAVPGFETAWNAVVGVPLLLPAFTYTGVHQSHHNLGTYGTAADPEYLPFRRSRGLILLFAAQSSVLVPALLVLRFLLLAPVGLLWPRFHRWLERHASSFAMNPAYERVVSPSAARKMRMWEAVAVAVWSIPIVLLVTGRLPIHVLGLWYGVMVLISFLNTLRVLGAHGYETDGQPRDRVGQLQDSIDTPGGPWTTLWAPVGLRYHALHHYFPGIPYHNLGVAYRRILAGLPADAFYRESTSPGLRHSVVALYAAAERRYAALVDWAGASRRPPA